MKSGRWKIIWFLVLLVVRLGVVCGLIALIVYGLWWVLAALFL